MDNSANEKVNRKSSYSNIQKSRQPILYPRSTFENPILDQKWLMIRSKGTISNQKDNFISKPHSQDQLTNDSNTIQSINDFNKLINDKNATNSRTSLPTICIARKQKEEPVKNSKIILLKNDATEKENESLKLVKKMKPEVEYNVRLLTEKAIEEDKIFVCQGPYPCLRDSLTKRGWVEKFTSKTEGTVSIPKSVLADNNFLDSDGVCRNTKLALMAYLVKDVTPKLIFTVKASDVIQPTISPEQVVNHYAKASIFTTKAGLMQSLRELMWYSSNNPNLFFPRCYNLGIIDDKLAFIEDFKLTACANFLRHFIRKFSTKKSIFTTPLYSITTQDKKLQTKKSTDSLDTNKLYVVESSLKVDGSDEVLQGRKLSKFAVKFALKKVNKYLKNLHHDDIDQPVKTTSENSWKQFLEWCHLFIRDEIGMEEDARSMQQEVINVLAKFKKVFRQFEMDGEDNIWILKPAAKSRGRGIQCVNNLHDIEEAIGASDCNLIIQKYIERPLLIFNTKFDIRLWFLVTDWNPMHLWIYKDCYLRFCSQSFSLHDFHESIHLSNNSVQKNYKLAANRHPGLPEDNMWTSQQFNTYLNENGYGNVWDLTVMPGMKQCLINVLLCTQEYVEHRKGTFELFGADFMLSSDMQPWLLEINSSPSMARTTQATAILVTRVLEDMVKVVIDRETDENCKTGAFELTKVQEKIEPTQNISPQLCIVGNPLGSQLSVS